MDRSAPIVGHAEQIAELETDITSGNIAHAYLFAGADHLGKMKIGKYFATRIITNGLEEEEMQSALHQIDRLLHPDLLILDQLWIEEVCDDWDIIAKSSNVSQVHRSKKPAAKTDTISIDDVRILQDRLYETGTGTHRVCIIRSLERMQDAAANAFLKILEEPPTGVVFILTTQHLSLLLPTLVSRTRTVLFRPLSRAELLPLVANMSEEDQLFILRIAQGAPGILCALRDDPDVLRMHRTLHAQALDFWRSSSVGTRLSLLQPLHKRGEESERFLFHLALALRSQKDLSPLYSPAFHEMARSMRTNAHRQLLAQQFTLTVS